MHTNPCLPTENRYTINVWSGMCETGHKSGPETLQGVFQRYLRGQIPSITFCFWFWDILILIIDLSLAQGKVGLFTALRSKYCWTCWAHYFQLSSPFHNKMCFFCWRSLRAQGLSTRRPVISVIKKKNSWFFCRSSTKIRRIQQKLSPRQTLCRAEPTVDTLHPSPPCPKLFECDLGHQERLQRRKSEGDESASISTGQEGEGPALHTCLEVRGVAAEICFKLT